MAQPRILFVVAAIFLVVLGLMASATPVRGSRDSGRIRNMEAKPVSRSLEEVTVSHLEKEPAELSNADESSQPKREVKIPGVCSQATGALIVLLAPCAGAVTNPGMRPPVPCCLGTRAVSDACFCYLETMLAGRNFGFTVDDAYRVARECGRYTVIC